MSLWSAQDAALATGGKTAGKWQAEGVSIDTRTLRAGDLFVALADQRDGHDFVADALQKGASAALVSRRPADVLSDENLLYVQDVQIALEGLARAARHRSAAQVIALTARMAERLRRAEALDGKLSPSSSAFAVAEVERIEFVHELWLPSHHDYASVGAVLRVMNYLCFVNSKVLFRQLRNQPASASSGTPVALQIDYHSDTLPRMRASLARYLDGRGEDLRALPLSDASDAKAGAEAGPLGCSRSGATGSSASKIGAHLIAHSPYAWGGVGDMIFQEEGVLETPWGKGEWGLHPSDGAGTAVYADFVGAKHNVRFELSSGMGVSTRCTDNNVVLVRSIKAAKAKAK